METPHKALYGNDAGPIPPHDPTKGSVWVVTKKRVTPFTFGHRQWTAPRTLLAIKYVLVEEIIHDVRGETAALGFNIDIPAGSNDINIQVTFN